MSDLDVFSYENYRDILKDYYISRKNKGSPRFSYRLFSRLTGFKSTNFIQLVIMGKKNLSYDSMQRLAKVMGLKGRRYNYFKNLVLFNQALSPAEKSTYHEKLLSFKEYKDARMVTDSERIYFSKWYYPVVREMIKLSSFRPDPVWIAKSIQPNIIPEQAMDALDVLKKLNLIAVTKNGVWVQKDAQLRTSDQQVNHEVMLYHRRMIHLGADSLAKPGHARDISGMTMSLSPIKFKMIQKKIAQFRQEIREIIQQPLSKETIAKYSQLILNKTSSKDLSKITQVSQLNIQMFHLTDV